MYLCYLDESGTVSLGGGTSHFVLLGFAVPADLWLDKDQRITRIKQTFGLKDAEIHTGYIARRFPEQERISGFTGLDWPSRRIAVRREREAHLIRTAALRDNDKLNLVKKLYRKTQDYIHLSHVERWNLLDQLADEIHSWTEIRLFAEAVEKTHGGSGELVFRQAFEQVVTRFHTYLSIREADREKHEAAASTRNYGVLIQDNNETVKKNLTNLMRRFHTEGTLWAKIPRIVETPLFVDSTLTSMVQMADLCAYATRRYFENNEDRLFKKIAARFDRKQGRMVGIRHFTSPSCHCMV